MKVKLEMKNHGSLQIDQLILIDYEIPLIFHDSNHSVIRGLEWLLKLRSHERAANCKFDEAWNFHILNGFIN